MEEGRPVEPLWECIRIGPSEEEAPFLVTEDREGFFPADADGADVTGCGEVVEDIDYILNDQIEHLKYPFTDFFQKVTKWLSSHF